LLHLEENLVFHGTYDRADRYRKVAAEYTGLSKATPDQFLRAYYLRIADDYTARVDREVQALAKEGSAALPGA
jgi:hypothetical protein